MADVVSTPILTDNQNKSELCSGDSDYGSQHANGSFAMEVDEASTVKQEPPLGSFEAALAAAAAGATHRKKENAPPPKKIKEEYSDDDDIPWAERMAKEKKDKPSEKKKDKKRKGGSDSEDEYKPEVRSCIF
ncbi:hypothetical protein COOONC_03103 [Cooperia oncophora]